MKIRKRTKTYYRYAAVYFIALFLITALVMTGVLFLSAHELNQQETRSLKNSMKQAAELMEKQYQVMENIALQIGTKIDFRPYRVEQGGVYDIDLLERFKQYINYSPLATHYFLVYESVQKIYTSTGYTSYFDYYAPEKLQIPYELTAEVLQRITEAHAPYIELSGGSILAVFPVRFSGGTPSDARPASLCIVLTEGQIKTYLEQMTAGLPESYGISMGGKALFQTGGFPVKTESGSQLTVDSLKGRVTLSTNPDFSGWTLLFERDGWVIVACIAVSLLLAALTALTMARFSLKPLDQLIEKYTGEPKNAIENEFRELDEILSNMEQRSKGSQYQLTNYLLVLLLRGNYSEKILHRWAMLGVSFEHPMCCVYLIDDASASPVREEMGAELESLSNDHQRIYTAEIEEDPHLIVIANYDSDESQNGLAQCIEGIARKRGRAVYAGKPVETPKRIPISYMHAMTESRLPLHAPEKRTPSAEQLSEQLIAAVIADDPEKTERAEKAVEEFLSEEPLNGALTRHHAYELTSNIIRKAEEKGIQVDRASVNALVLLPDPAMVVHDATEVLRKEAGKGIRIKEETDETARLIVEYVIANAYDPDLNLQAMSEAFGLSADYISGMIKRETGSAFKEYVTMLRISEAQRLLKDKKNLNINEVAMMVGYRKASNFSKKYKELTGLLPSQSR